MSVLFSFGCCIVCDFQLPNFKPLNLFSVANDITAMRVVLRSCFYGLHEMILHPVLLSA